MLNQIVIVGKTIKLLENGVKIRVERSYTNANGEYDFDILTVKITGNLMESVKSYYEDNMLLGVKGRLENEKGKITIFAEKITFLSSRKEQIYNEN